METQELLDGLSETFLWEIVSAYIEHPRFLPDMLRNVGYIENKDEIIQKVDDMEIMDSEEPEIFDSNTENGRISFGFEMPFVMIAKSGEEQLLRITTTASGQCSIPDENAFDWSAFDWEDMDKPELLSHKDLAEFSEMRFEEVECDDLSVE
ncbi:MAG: hypothetical protein HDT42_13215 [Ruminococcaceae bacterium]|nr:hypothetical protein [Oscillospiraceae bacterium]